jgi:hypothetical protein
MLAVYRNLTRDCWSVCNVSSTGKSRGKLVCHAETVLVSGCIPYVSECARQRVIRVGHREVHAWIIGDDVRVDAEEIDGERVTYRPFDGGTFIYADTGCEFTGCDRLSFHSNGRVHKC